MGCSYSHTNSKTQTPPPQLFLLQPLHPAPHSFFVSSLLRRNTGWPACLLPRYVPILHRLTFRRCPSNLQWLWRRLGGALFYPRPHRLENPLKFSRTGRKGKGPNIERNSSVFLFASGVGTPRVLPRVRRLPRQCLPLIQFRTIFEVEIHKFGLILMMSFLVMLEPITASSLQFLRYQALTLSSVLPRPCLFKR